MGTIFLLSLCHAPEGQYFPEESLYMHLLAPVLYWVPCSCAAAWITWLWWPVERGLCFWVPRDCNNQTQLSSSHHFQGTVQTAERNSPRGPVCFSWSFGLRGSFWSGTHLRTCWGALLRWRLVDSILKIIYSGAVLDLCGCMQAFSSCSRRGIRPSCGAWAFHCSGFSCYVFPQWLRW